MLTGPVALVKKRTRLVLENKMFKRTGLKKDV